MKVLSIQQPWADLIVKGLKNIENRDWTTRYRGPLLIHAGQRFDPFALDWICQHLSEDERRQVPMHRRDYQLGGIVGVVMFTDIVTSSESRWFQGPYGWHFEQATPLEFYPLRGKLGLFEAHPAVVRAIKQEYEQRKALA